MIDFFLDNWFDEDAEPDTLPGNGKIPTLNYTITHTTLFSTIEWVVNVYLDSQLLCKSKPLFKLPNQNDIKQFMRITILTYRDSLEYCGIDPLEEMKKYVTS